MVSLVCGSWRGERKRQVENERETSGAEERDQKGEGEGKGTHWGVILAKLQCYFLSCMNR